MKARRSKAFGVSDTGRPSFRTSRSAGINVTGPNRKPWDERSTGKSSTDTSADARDCDRGTSPRHTTLQESTNEDQSALQDVSKDASAVTQVEDVMYSNTMTRASEPATTAGTSGRPARPVVLSGIYLAGDSPEPRVVRSVNHRPFRADSSAPTDLHRPRSRAGVGGLAPDVSGAGDADRRWAAGRPSTHGNRRRLALRRVHCGDMVHARRGGATRLRPQWRPGAEGHDRRPGYIPGPGGNVGAVRCVCRRRCVVPTTPCRAQTAHDARNVDHNRGPCCALDGALAGVSSAGVPDRPSAAGRAFHPRSTFAGSHPPRFLWGG